VKRTRQLAPRRDGKKRTRKALASAAGPPNSRPEALTKRRSQWPESEEAFRPRPSHFRYLRAYAELLEERGPINKAAIARRMGITPAAFWIMRKRCAGLDAWVSEQLGRKNGLFADSILRKMAVLAEQGSVPHAELYFKVLGGAFARPNETAGGVTVNTSGAPAVINIAVPRPGDLPVSSSQ
jgi:hypothetical protein